MPADHKSRSNATRETKRESPTRAHDTRVCHWSLQQVSDRRVFLAIKPIALVFGESCTQHTSSLFFSHIQPDDFETVAMKVPSLFLLLAATAPCFSALELRGGRELRDANEAREKEFQGIEVVPMKDSSDKDEPVQIARKAKVPSGFKRDELMEKKDSVTIQFKEGGKKYKRPLVSPGSCCCACKELPCECACDVEFNTKQGYPRLGRIVGGKANGKKKESKAEKAERKKRERAERKAKRKAEKRRERKRLKREEAKRKNGGRLLRSPRHLKVHPKTNLVHYEDSSVLMSCGQCESFPCTSKATVLIFRHDND